MAITRLEVRDFRNLASVSLDPGPRLNLIEGPNGSGKTSLLEAIHLAGVGRSFLTHQRQIYIRQGASDTTVFVMHGAGEEAQRIGVRCATTGDTEFRRNGEKLDTRAALAQGIPVAVITPDSHALVEGGPKVRRGFLDWGLFHVEHSFLEAWRHYQRALRQRNAALSQGHREAEAWVPSLIEMGERIDGARRSLVQRLREQLTGSPLLAGLPGAVALDYEAGWLRDRGLGEAIARDHERDRRDGYTHSGPHRAELKLRVDERLATDCLSRGQVKLLVCGLWLAQLKLLRETLGARPVVLLDDLPSELDERNRSVLLDALYALEAQVFVTTTDRALTPSPRADTRLFHVEQGRFVTVI
ncbi:MAG: DNA replication/repair protein RecF [Thiohalomonadaceae bacterium]